MPFKYLQYFLPKKERGAIQTAQKNTAHNRDLIFAKDEALWYSQFVLSKRHVLVIGTAFIVNANEGFISHFCIQNSDQHQQG